MVGLYNADIIPAPGLNGAASNIWSLKSHEYYKRLNSWPTAVTAPDAPTNLSAFSRDSGAYLSWSAPTNTGGISIIDYIIEYKLTSNINWQIYNDSQSSSTFINITGLTNDLSYSFRVKTVNGVGESSYSSIASTIPTSQVSYDYLYKIINLVYIIKIENTIYNLDYDVW
jgi:predicted phage tail protein